MIIPTGAEPVLGDRRFERGLCLKADGHGLFFGDFASLSLKTPEHVAPEALIEIGVGVRCEGVGVRAKGAVEMGQGGLLFGEPPAMLDVEDARVHAVKKLGPLGAAAARCFDANPIAGFDAELFCGLGVYLAAGLGVNLAQGFDLAVLGVKKVREPPAGDDGEGKFFFCVRPGAVALGRDGYFLLGRGDIGGQRIVAFVLPDG